MNFGFLSALRTSHGYDCIHWVAKSCTTTAYRWLCRDPHPSLRTLWSAVIKSIKFSVLGTTVPVRLLQEALVISSSNRVSQFRSFGKWVKMLCFLGTTFARGSKGNSREELEASRCSGTHSSTNPCMDSVDNPAHLATHHSAIIRRHVFFGFSISVDSCHEFPRADESPLAFSLLLVARISVSVTVSCEEDVGEVDEVEELVDKPGTTNGTWFDVSQWNFLPFLMRCGFWPLIQW